MASRRLGNKIIAVARNYAAHAAEMGSVAPKEPVIFLKPMSSVVWPGQPVELPRGVSELHHEVELAVQLSRGGKDIAMEDAMEHVAGYRLSLDMTDRALQAAAKEAGMPWTASKGGDTFTPLSDVLLSRDELPEVSGLGVWVEVNGERKQDGNTDDMIHDVAKLIAFSSRVMTLEEGDIILTGTPEGVGPVREGDVMRAGLADLLTMEFPVVARD
eukprot:PLAT1901.1.p1 GENE.PLAT1901.1~~PLAT1901.1.p1  ORF type:complete len:228 (+),score=87.49 PLAT1901.1:40-684(+)